MTVDAYPLAWPVGWARTPAHRRSSSAYKVDFTKARNDLAREVNLLGGIRGTIVVSSNVPTRRDGFPVSNFRQPDDPGVAVYWTVRKRAPSSDPTIVPPTTVLEERVIACDSWRTVRENVRAIGLAIGALRQLERTGASEILDRAFSGFAALPPAGTAIERVRSWREVLELTAEKFPVDRLFVEQRFRELAKLRHPDTGGTPEAFRELVAARDAALEELRRGV